MFSLINRGRLPERVQEEFEHLISRLRGYLSQIIDADGNLIVADPNLAVVPVGGVMPFAGTTAPEGFLLCDGSQVNRVTYKSLFDIIGTTYGAGDGSTTFTLPDLRQRFPLGKAAAGTGSALGSTGGNIDHTHSGTTSSDGSHSHSVSAHSHSIPNDGSHLHAVNNGAVETVAFDGGGSVGVYPATDTEPDHDHTGSTGSESPDTNSAGAHTHTMTTGSANPPYIALNYIIFAGR